MEEHSEKDLDTHDPVEALKRADDKVNPPEERTVTPQPKKESTPTSSKLLHIYDKHYKMLLIIPTVILILSISSLFVMQATTGEFFQKDVSVKGGVTFTILTEQDETDLLERELSEQFATPVSVRVLTEAGQSRGLIVEAGLEGEAVQQLQSELESRLGVTRDDISAREIGSSLGASFFQSMIQAMIYAFAGMAIMVFIYFRFLSGSWNVVPSLFIVWSILIDIVSTFAVISIMQVPVSTAGLAAFLLLIGYSVDTDILLTARMLKSRQVNLFDRIVSAARTGVFMTLAGMAAIFVGLMITQSDTIRQIMLILFIGLGFDLVYTWLGNAAILRWYMERGMYVRK